MLSITGVLLAQNNPNLENGVVPFGSYDGGDFDSINLFTGNLAIHIPLFNYPQRGTLPGQVDIVSNTKNFYVLQTCNTQLETCTLAWRLHTPFGPEIVPVTDALGFATPFKGQNAQGLQVITWDGSTHQLILTTGGNYETLDTSGIWANNQFPNASFLGRTRTRVALSNRYL